MGAGIFYGNQFPVDAAVAESRRNQNAVQVFQFCLCIFFIQRFAVNPFDIDFAVIDRPCVDEGFDDGFVGIVLPIE